MSFSFTLVSHFLRQWELYNSCKEGKGVRVRVSSDDSLDCCDDPAEHLPEPHADAVFDNALYGALVKGHQQSMGEEVIPESHQEIESLLCLCWWLWWCSSSDCPQSTHPGTKGWRPSPHNPLQWTVDDWPHSVHHAVNHSALSWYADSSPSVITPAAPCGTSNPVGQSDILHAALSTARVSDVCVHLREWDNNGEFPAEEHNSLT